MNVRFVFYLILVTRKLIIEELFNALIMNGRYAFLMRYAFLIFICIFKDRSQRRSHGSGFSLLEGLFGPLGTQFMLILILTDVKNSPKAAFSFEKGLNLKNHSSSGFLHSVNPPPIPASKISDSPPPTPYRHLENPVAPVHC